MNSRSIFISCVYEDSPKIEMIKKWAMDKRIGDVVITHETEDKRYEGKEAIKQHIKNKIQGAAFVFVLIGHDTHNHDWIQAEVELANSFHKDIICIRVPQTRGAVPQILLNKKIIAFDPDAIKRVTE